MIVEASITFTHAVNCKINLVYERCIKKLHFYLLIYNYLCLDLEGQIHYHNSPSAFPCIDSNNQESNRSIYTYHPHGFPGKYSENVLFLTVFSSILFNIKCMLLVGIPKYRFFLNTGIRYFTVF